MASLVSLSRALLSVLFDRPIRVKLPTGDGHYYPWSGVVLPAISGAAGEGEQEEEKGKEPEGAKGSEEEEEEEAAAEEEEKGEAKTAEDYRKELRTSERRWKRTGEKNKAELEKLRGDLKDREESDKSEQEKAVDKAREEGRSEALTTAEKDRRADKLEVAVSRLATKPIEIGDGDDKKKVRFADSDDALLYIERAIAKGEIDADDIFDDSNQVKADALKGELAELLESKPHYQARGDSGDEPGRKKGKSAAGDGDQGKGSGSGSKDLEEMSAEDHLKRIQKGGK